MMEKTDKYSEHESKDSGQKPDEKQDKTEDFTLPGLPGRQEPLRPKPLLEKATSKERPPLFGGLIQKLLQRKKLLIGLTLISFLFLGFILFKIFYTPKYTYTKDIGHRVLPFPTINKEKFYIVSGQEDVIERLVNAFKILPGKERGSRFIARKIVLVNEEEDNLASELVLLPQTEDVFFEDQLKYLELLVATDNYDEFVSFLAELKTHFNHALSEDNEAWPMQLRYIRTLFIAGQLWQSELIDQEIEAIETILLPQFEKNLSAQNVDNFTTTGHVQVSSLEPEDFPETYTLPVIYLESIDLWVLENLASRYEAWQEIYEQWLNIIKGGRLESGFYSYAWNLEENSYIPSATQSFRSDTKSSLQQSIYLFEVAEGRPEDILLFNQLLLRDNGLYSSYNSASLAPMTEEKSLSSSILLRRLAFLAGQDLSDRLADSVIKAFLADADFPPCEGLLYETEEAWKTFNFSDNVEYLLLLALLQDR